MDFFEPMMMTMTMNRFPIRYPLKFLVMPDQNGEDNLEKIVIIFDATARTYLLPFVVFRKKNRFFAR